MDDRWIGVDLDCTLAKYDEFRGMTHIGEPIPLMVYRVKKWLAEGKNVKIFTARVASSYPKKNTAVVRHAIEAWCLEHLGQILEVTAEKDFNLIEFWDDRAVGVEPNTGLRMDGEKDYECVCCDEPMEGLGLIGPNDCECSEWCPNG